MGEAPKSGSPSIAVVSSLAGEGRVSWEGEGFGVLEEEGL